MALKVGELFASFNIDSSGVEGSMAQIEKQCNSVAAGMAVGGAAMTAAITTPVVNAFKDIMNKGKDFDAQMSSVFAKRGLDKSIEADAAQMDALRAKAMEMGATTEWTATQAAEALDFMAMAGWSVDAMLAGLPALMNLATAGGTDLGRTSDIVTDTMTAMGYTLESVGGDTEKFAEMTQRFADVLAASATNSNTSIDLLGTSFEYVAGLAGSMGYSIEDTALALSIMADNGIKATMSGAAMRNLLVGLTGTTKATATACEALGLSLYDERGQAKPLVDVLGDLRSVYQKHSKEIDTAAAKMAEYDEKLAKGTMTQKEYDEAVDDLIGSQESFLFHLTKLAGKQGLSGLLGIMRTSDERFAELKDAIYNCDGAAAAMAATMLDNAEGALTLLGSAVDGLELKLWNLYSEGFINVVNGAKEMVDQLNATDPALLDAGVKTAALAAALGPVMLKGAAITALFPKMAGAIMGLVSPLGIASLGLGVFAIAAVDSENKIGELFETLAKNGAEKLREFNSTIEQDMQTISDRMPATIGSIVSSIDTILPELMTAGAKIVTGLMNAIEDNADGLVSIGGSIITNVVTGIGNNLPTLVPAAFKMVTKIGAAIVGYAPELLSSGLALAQGLIDGIMNTDFVDLSNQLITAISNTFSDESWDGIAESAGKLGTSIINAIVKVIKDAGAIGVNIINAIGEMFSNIPWESKELNLTGFSDMLFNGIVNAINAAKDSTVNIVNALGDLFANIPWDSAEINLETIATSIINGLVNALSAATTGLTEIADAIAGVISRVDWKEAASAAADLAGAIFKAVAEGAAKLSPEMGELLTAIGRGIAAAGSELKTVASELMAKLTTALISPDNWLSFIKIGATIVQGIATGILKLGVGILEGAWSTVSGAFMGVLRGLGFDVGISEETQAAMASMATVVTKGGEVLLGTVDDVFQQLLNYDPNTGLIFDPKSMQAAMANYNTAIQQGSAEMVESISQLSWLAEQENIDLFNTLFNPDAADIDRADALTSIIEKNLAGVNLDALEEWWDNGGIVETASGIGETVAEEMATGMEENADVVEQAAQKMTTAAEVAMETYEEAVANLPGAAAQGTADGIANNGNAATEAMNTLASEITVDALAQLGYDGGYSAGYTYAGGIAAGIGTGGTEAVTAMSTAASAAVVIASVTLSSYVGNGIGYNFAAGIAAGISSGASLIADEAAAAASSAVTASQGALEIHSPSRLAEREIGRMYDLGIAKGITGYAYTVMDAGSELAAAMHEQMYVADPSRGQNARYERLASNVAAQNAYIQNTTAAQSSNEGLVEKIASALHGAISGIAINMDGEKVADALAPAVSEIIAESTTQRRFAPV